MAPASSSGTGRVTTPAGGGRGVQVFVLLGLAAVVAIVTLGNAGEETHGTHRRWFGGRRAMARVLDRRKHHDHFERRGFDPAAETYAHDVLHYGEDDGELSDFRYDGMYDAADSYDGDAEWDGDHYNEDYFDDDFNITDRLVTLFPSIDADGNLKVTVAEMEQWHYENGINASRTRAGQEFNATDEDGNGKVSLKEYLRDDFFDELLTPHGAEPKKEPEADAPPDENGDTDDNHYTREWARTMTRQFRAADGDGDGELNEEEFGHFLNPEDSGKDALLSVLLDEDISDRDDNSDGKLDFSEFESSLWYALSENVETTDENGEFDEDKDHRLAEAKFKELDVDQDGHIVASELKSVLAELHPTEKDYAKTQAENMIEQADTDKDGQLTLKEMTENPYVFYSAAFKGNSDDDTYHDEFR